MNIIKIVKNTLFYSIFNVPNDEINAKRKELFSCANIANEHFPKCYLPKEFKSINLLSMNFRSFLDSQKIIIWK